MIQIGVKKDKDEIYLSFACAAVVTGEIIKIRARMTEYDQKTFELIEQIK